MTYRFVPSLWATLATLLGVALLASLGFWQRGRGLEKQFLLTAHAQAAQAAILPLTASTPLPPPGEWRRVQVQGHYTGDSVLLENQSQQRQPGSHAWSAFALPDGARVVVDRGWLPLNAAIAPPPAGPQQFTAWWRALPRAGMRLSHDPQCLPGQSPPLRVNYPDIAELRCLFGPDTRAGLLLLAAEAPGGYRRDWQPDAAAIPPARHYAYAAQWWAFAATLLAIYCVLNLRKAAR